MLLRSRKPATGTALVPATPPARPKAAQRNRGPSIIAADLHIVGNVSTEGELHIDGRIDGDVEGRSVTVGESGYVDGHIETQTVAIRGIVRGSIRARRVHLVTGCKVIADITHDALSIDEGAAFEGHCRRVVEDERRHAGARLAPLGERRSGRSPCGVLSGGPGLTRNSHAPRHPGARHPRRCRRADPRQPGEPRASPSLGDPFHGSGRLPTRGSAARSPAPTWDWWCREATSGGVVGVVNLMEIVANPFYQGAYLGYYGMAALAGRGLITEAVRLATVHAFQVLGLHRLEANIQPSKRRARSPW